MRSINDLDPSVDRGPRPGGGDRLALDVCVDDIPWSQPGGVLGATPADRAEPAPVGASGTSGTVDIRAQTTLADLAALLSPSHASMLLNACTRDYINQDFDSAAERLIWLKGLLATALQMPATASPPTPALQSYRAYNACVDVLLRQLQSRLDYYGRPLNQVTLLSFSSYEKILNALIDYGNNIENAYLKYTQEKNDNETAVAAFRSVYAREMLNIQNLEGANANLASQQQELADTIVRLAEGLNEVWVQLLGAEASFKAAVAAKGLGCDFEQIVAIAASVATLVTTGGAANTAIGTALTAVANKPLTYDGKKPVGDDFAGFKFKVTTISTAGNNLKAFKDAYNTLGGQVTSPNPDVPGLPSDAAKILASAQDVEEQLKPFMDMPEARKYNVIMRAFVTIATARNNKILEYNNAILAWQKNNADMDRSRADASAAQAAVAATQNPFVAEAVAFMTRAWLDAKASIVRCLLDINASYNYFSLQRNVLALNDLSVVALQSTAINILTLYTQSRQRFGSQPANITGMRLELLPFISASALKAFKTSGKVTVAIPPEVAQLRRYSHVLATKVGLEMANPGGPAKSVEATLTHEGRALVFDAQGVAHTFSHVAVAIPYQLLDGRVVVDGTSAVSEYEGLSPYGPWTIQVATPDKAFLSKITRMTLVFDGKARARA